MAQVMRACLDGIDWLGLALPQGRVDKFVQENDAGGGCQRDGEDTCAQDKLTRIEATV